MRRAFAFLVVPALLLTACGGGGAEGVDELETEPAATTTAASTTTTEAVEALSLRLTFDGESCTYEGATELTAGPVELIFLNESEETAAVNFLILLEDKTIQDMTDRFGEEFVSGVEPTTEHHASWMRELGTWRPVAAGVSFRWEGDLEPAKYAMVCARTSPLLVWFGTGLTVES